ncbi:MAG: HTTM domain-containing protein [Bacteriovoracaceae bacterium]
MKIADIKSTWNNIFFKEAPVDGICLFRILLGTVLLMNFCQDLSHFQDFWGPLGLQSVETFRNHFNGFHLNLFHLLEGTHASLYLILGLHFASLMGFLFGYKTRISSIVLLITLTSINQRNINMLNSADILLRIMAILMVFAPAGNKFSIDAMIAKRKGERLKENWAPWVHRLVQIQIAVVYLSTVWAKAKGDLWFDGTAVYYATRLEDFTRFSVPFILDNLITLKMITWSSLAIELALGSLIFIDELRKKVIVIGVSFHLGIEYMMSIPTFEILMIACLLAMFKVEEYPALLKQFEIKWEGFKTKLQPVFLPQGRRN